MPSILTTAIRQKNRIILCIIILLLNTSCANEHTNELENVHFSYRFFIDKEAKYSIKDINKIPFQEEKEINYPFLKCNLWIAINLENLSNEKQEFIVQNNDRLNWSYKLYIKDKKNAQLKLEKEKDYDYEDGRTFNFSKPNFRVTLAPKENQEVFLFAVNNGKVLRATPSIVSLNRFFQIINTDIVANIFFYGVVCIILLINVFYWKLFKKRIYLYYILYIVSTTCFYISFDGYLYGIGLPIYIVDHITFIFFQIMIYSLLMFSAMFLKIKEIVPKFYFVFKNYLVLVTIGVFIYQFFFCKTEVGKLHFVEYCLGFGWILIMISMIIISFKKNRTEAKYYLIALFFIVVAVLYGWLRIYFTTETTGRLFFKVATTIEFVVFTYSTALILGRNLRKIEIYKADKSLLENKHAALQKKVFEIEQKSLRKTDILSIFKLLEFNLKNEGEWNSFKNEFQELNPNFLVNLNKEHSKLSKTDIRLLVLIKIGFTQKEISKMLFIAECSVKKAKQRVRKKMELDVKTPLFEYLERF